MSFVNIIENLVVDLLSMVFSIEWPGAALLLTRLSAAFGTLLEDKTSADARGVAIDQLGLIAARLREVQLELVDRHLPLGRITVATIPSHLQAIVEGYADTIRKLDGQESGDVAAIDAALAYWQAQALTDVSALIESIGEGVESVGSSRLLEIAQHGKATICRLYDHIEPFSKVETKDEDAYDGTAKMLCMTSPTFVSFDFLKKRLLRSVDEQAVGNRAKALRAIGAISAVDADLLEDEQIRGMIETRLADSSPGVRDTAVNLLGKYLMRKKDRIAQHFSQLIARLHDSSLAVRKRVIKLLSGFYDILQDDQLRIDLCVRIVRCVADEDSGLQQLALTTISEIWFGQAAPVEQPEPSNRPATPARVLEIKDDRASSKSDNRSQRGGSSVASESDMGVDDLAEHAPIIIAVCGQLRERSNPLEEVFKRITRGCTDHPSAQLLQRKFRGLVERLISDLVANEGQSQETFVNSVKTVYTIVSTHPTTLSVSRTKALLPYLKSAETVSTSHQSLQINC